MRSLKPSQKNEFAASYRIYYEDTDLGGVVYYANYLKFFERARTDFLREKGVVQSKLAAEINIMFAVRNCQIDYVKPAKMDDLIEVSVEIIEIGKVSLKMKQEIKLDDMVLCKMTVEIVCVNSANFKPTRIPASILN